MTVVKEGKVEGVAGQATREATKGGIEEEAAGVLRDLGWAAGVRECFCLLLRAFV